MREIDCVDDHLHRLVIALLSLCGFTATVALVGLYCTTRGSIFEPSRRNLVVPLIILQLVAMASCLAVSSYIFAYMNHPSVAEDVSKFCGLSSTDPRFETYKKQALPPFILLLVMICCSIFFVIATVAFFPDKGAGRDGAPTQHVSLGVFSSPTFQIPNSCHARTVYYVSCAFPFLQTIHRTGF